MANSESKARAREPACWDSCAWAAKAISFDDGDALIGESALVWRRARSTAGATRLLQQLMDAGKRDCAIAFVGLLMQRGGTIRENCALDVLDRMDALAGTSKFRVTLSVLHAIASSSRGPEFIALARCLMQPWRPAFSRHVARDRLLAPMYLGAMASRESLAALRFIGRADAGALAAFAARLDAKRNYTLDESRTSLMSAALCCGSVACYFALFDAAWSGCADGDPLMARRWVAAFEQCCDDYHDWPKETDMYSFFVESATRMALRCAPDERRVVSFCRTCSYACGYGTEALAEAVANAVRKAASSAREARELAQAVPLDDRRGQDMRMAAAKGRSHHMAPAAPPAVAAPRRL